MIIASRHPHWTDTYPKSQTQNKKAHIGIAEKSGKPVWASFHNSKIIFNRFLSWAVRQNDKPYHPHSLYLLTYPHPKIDPIYTRTALYVGLLSLTYPSEPFISKGLRSGLRRKTKIALPKQNQLFQIPAEDAILLVRLKIFLSINIYPTCCKIHTRCFGFSHLFLTIFSSRSGALL